MNRSDYIEALKRERGGVAVSHANAVERGSIDRADALERQLADIDAEIAVAEGGKGKQTATGRGKTETTVVD